MPSLRFLRVAPGSAAHSKDKPKSFSPSVDWQSAVGGLREAGGPPRPSPAQSPLPHPSHPRKALTIVLAVSPAEPRHGPSGWQAEEEVAGQRAEGGSGPGERACVGLARAQLRAGAAEDREGP